MILMGKSIRHKWAKRKTRWFSDLLRLSDLGSFSVDPNAANANFGTGGFGGTNANSTSGTSSFDPNKLNQGFGSGSGFGNTG